MADERVQQERHRRSSMAAVLYGEEYSPLWSDDPENFTPTNLPEGTESMYLRLVNAGLAQPVVDETASKTPKSPPSVAREDGAMMMMAQIMQQMADGNDRRESRSLTLSQKDATALIAAVPSVAPNGVVLTGAKLIAWFKEANDTWLPEKFWTSAFAFNASSKLFSDAPDLLATWSQYTQSDAQVVRARESEDWKHAWTLLSKAIIRAHTGDRHGAQRSCVKAQGHLFQHPGKTVQDVSALHLEHVQKKSFLGLFDGIQTLLTDVLADADSNPHDRGEHSMFGLDFGLEGDCAIHNKIVAVLQHYVDYQRALELYGALNGEAQTELEDKIGEKLLTPPKKHEPRHVGGSRHACAAARDSRRGAHQEHGEAHASPRHRRAQATPWQAQSPRQMDWRQG